MSDILIIVVLGLCVFAIAVSRELFIRRWYAGLFLAAAGIFGIVWIFTRVVQ